MATILETRRERLMAAMEAEDIDMLLLHGSAWRNDYLRYATDFGILEGEALALVGRNGEVTLYLDDATEAERASVELSGVRTVLVDNLVEDVAEVVQRHGNRRVGAGPAAHMPYGLSRRSEALRLSDATALLDRLLLVKAADELDAIRRAAWLADAGYEIFRRAAIAGREDYALIAEIEAFFRANGADDNFMIIGVGGQEVRGMAPPSGKRLKQGDLVTTELTPCVEGYFVQICRTLVVGEPNEAQKKAFGVYHEAMLAGIEAVRPGVTAADIALAENDVFRRYGLGDYVTTEYTRVRGHGIGLFLDTRPQILEDVTMKVEEGMALIVHPNTYHPEVGYMVLGDSLIVVPQGAEVLTKTPRELFAVAQGDG
jgi:Xaa-Pro aminopeptidase